MQRDEKMIWNHLLQRNELLRAFASLRILHYHESVEGKGVAELAAVRD